MTVKNVIINADTVVLFGNFGSHNKKEKLIVVFGNKEQLVLECFNTWLGVLEIRNLLITQYPDVNW